MIGVNIKRDWFPGAGRLSAWVSSLLVLLALGAAGAVRGAEPLAPGQGATPSPSFPEPGRKLLRALGEGNLPLLKAALAEHADVNFAIPVSGLTPLLELLRSAPAPLDRAQRECVAWLLDHGAKVDAEDADGRTPVIYATRLGDLDTLRLLVEAEAYVRTRDRFHKTALFYAVEANRRDLIHYLAQNGALISLSVKERRQMAGR